jgi:hypothetical protein
MLVVIPAAFATAAAGFAAKTSSSGTAATAIAAAWLAGSAAVLTAIHRALKCDEYQSECLRLSHAYQSIAILADSALANESEDAVKAITSKLEMLAESAKAALPNAYIRKAEDLIHSNCKSKPGVSIAADQALSPR